MTRTHQPVQTAKFTGKLAPKLKKDWNKPQGALCLGYNTMKQLEAATYSGMEALRKEADRNRRIQAEKQRKAAEAEAVKKREENQRLINGMLPKN